MKLTAALLLILLTGCTHLANSNTLRSACEARKLNCTVTRYADGTWTASAIRDNGSSVGDDFWYGHGSSKEAAMGGLLLKLDDNPDYCGYKEREVLTK